MERIRVTLSANAGVANTLAKKEKILKRIALSRHLNAYKGLSVRVKKTLKQMPAPRFYGSIPAIVFKLNVN